MGWRRDENDRLSAQFSDVECAVLGELTAQVVTLLDGADHRDVAVQRLLPDAYRDDRESADEFRRLTERDLAERKMEAARTIVHTVGDGGTVTIDEAQGWAWLRALTDLRLVLGCRLGITDDESAAAKSQTPSADGDVEQEFLKHAFEWLGFVQETLVAAMERRR